MADGWATVPKKDKKSKQNRAGACSGIENAKPLDKFAARIQANLENIEPPFDAFVFLCNNETEAECLRLQLFGLPAPLLEQMKGIVPYGDPQKLFEPNTRPTSLYLFNYQTRMMRGVFVAIDGPSINIEPDAWKSAHAKGFPAQVPIRLIDPNSVAQVPNSERFEAGPLMHSDAVELTRRLRATDFLTCKDIPVVKGLALGHEDESEQAREAAAARNAQQQAAWEESFKQLYPDGQAAPVPQTSGAGSWAALAKKSDPVTQARVPAGPPDLSGPSLSEAYRKPTKNNKPSMGAWGAKQQPVARQVWETDPPTVDGDDAALIWDTTQDSLPPPPQQGVWETQSNSSVGSETSGKQQRDLVAELAASMRTEDEAPDPVVNMPSSQGMDWQPHPVGPPPPGQHQQQQEVDWQAQAVQAQQQVMQFSAAMHRMQSQVQTYASFTSDLQSQLANETQQLAASQNRNRELQAQLEQGQASSSEQDGSSSQQQQLAEQLRTENDMLVQRCGQLVGEVGELRAQCGSYQEEAQKCKQALDTEQRRRAVLEGRTIHTLDLIELDRLQQELETSIATQLSALKACVAHKEQKLREEPLRGAAHDSSEKFLDELKCPLTKVLLHDPVTAADGHTYEREAMEEHLREQGQVSPVTGHPLPHALLAPNHMIKKLLAVDHLGSSPDSSWDQVEAEQSFFG